MEEAPVILFGANSFETGKKFDGIGALIKPKDDFLLQFVKDFSIILPVGTLESKKYIFTLEQYYLYIFFIFRNWVNILFSLGSAGQIETSQMRHTYMVIIQRLISVLFRHKLSSLYMISTLPPDNMNGVKGKTKVT